MRFKIIINKWAAFYFFIQNLSEWHSSCRKDYNNFWRSELEKFSTEEENSIIGFKGIRSKYKSSKTHFEQAFFLSENPLEELKKTVTLKRI